MKRAVTMVALTRGFHAIDVLGHEHWQLKEWHIMPVSIGLVKCLADMLLDESPRRLYGINSLDGCITDVDKDNVEDSATELRETADMCVDRFEAVKDIASAAESDMEFAMRAATDQLFAKLLVLGAMPGQLEKAELFFQPWLGGRLARILERLASKVIAHRLLREAFASAFLSTCMQAWQACFSDVDDNSLLSPPHGI